MEASPFTVAGSINMVSCARPQSMLRTIAPITVVQVHCSSRMNGCNGCLDRNKRAIWWWRHENHQMNWIGPAILTGETLQSARVTQISTLHSNKFSTISILTGETLQAARVTEIYPPFARIYKSNLRSYLSLVLVLLENENMPKHCLNIDDQPDKDPLQHHFVTGLPFLFI